MSNRGSELGTLIIVVLKARNLNDKHSLYKQDVFAQLTFNGTTKKTKVAVRGGQHPEWDEEIRYPVVRQSVDKFRKLEVACYSKEPRSDDILGKGEVDITDTLKTGEFDDWIPLNIDGVVRGDLYLEMTFYSNDPAPTPHLAPSHSVPPSNFQRRPSKLERINRPSQAYPQSGASQSPSTKPLHPGRHPSGLHAPDSDRPINQPRLAQQASIQPVSDRLATAALHNLLSDPVTGHQSPSNVYRNSNGQASRSSSASPLKRTDSPLPPIPREATPPAPLPPPLSPGGARPHPQQNLSHPYATPQLPSTLRAGSGRVVSSPNPSLYEHSQHSSPAGSLSRPSDYISIPGFQAYTPGSTPSHILTPANTQLTPGPQVHYPPSLSVNSTPSQSPYSAPVLMDRRPEAGPTESFSFPIPMAHIPAIGQSNAYAPPPVQANYIYTPPSAGNAPPPQIAYHLPPSKSSYLQSSYPTPTPQPTSHRHSSVQDEFPDLYLQARYSTPLPLPPESGSPPIGQQPVSSSTSTNPDQARIGRLRQVEKEKENSKTQEEKDRELALALDRELNLDNGSEPILTASRN